MSFLDIYGHERQIAILQKTIAQKRVGHAYLFSGINATGKKTLAGEFAKALNCEQADNHHDACGKCSSCQKAQHLSHVDMIFIEADGQFIRINAIREIQERMKFKPLEGRWRTVIIDDADKMNDHAANALLKTLEEPPPHAKFILATTEKHKIIPTILSRCQVFDFKRITIEDIAKHFEMVAEIEKKHEERYKTLLENVKNGKVLVKEEEKMWKCLECGHTHSGSSAPDICPVCSHPQAFFEVKCENYK